MGSREEHPELAKNLVLIGGRGCGKSSVAKRLARCNRHFMLFSLDAMIRYEAGVTDVLSRMMRQYRESITAFRDGGRHEAAAKEEAELAVLMRYLPEQLGPDEIRALAQAAAAEVGASGPSDRGKVMGKLMPQLRGRADGSVVNSVVGDVLEGIAGA